MTNQNTNPPLEKQITECLWNDLEKDGLGEKVYLLDYDLDLVEVATAMIENNTRLIKSLIADGLLYPPTQEEIDYFVNQDALLNTLKLESHTLIQSKVRI